MSSPHRHQQHYRPTSARASELKLLLLALGDAMPPMRRPALMRQRASQPLCVCVAPQGPARQPSIALSRPLPLSVSPPSLLFFPLLPPLYTRNPLPPTYPTPTHITMSTRSTRKRKNEEEELVELPEDSDAESEEE